MQKNGRCAFWPSNLVVKIEVQDLAVVNPKTKRGASDGLGFE